MGFALLSIFSGWAMICFGLFQINFFTGLGFIFFSIGMLVQKEAAGKQDYNNHLIWVKEIKDDIYSSRR